MREVQLAYGSILSDAESAWPPRHGAQGARPQGHRRLPASADMRFSLCTLDRHFSTRPSAKMSKVGGMCNRRSAGQLAPPAHVDVCAVSFGGEFPCQGCTPRNRWARLQLGLRWPPSSWSLSRRVRLRHVKSEQFAQSTRAAPTCSRLPQPAELPLPPPPPPSPSRVTAGLAALPAAGGLCHRGAGAGVPPRAGGPRVRHVHRRHRSWR